MPLDENRPTGTCGVQRQVPVSGTSVAEPLQRFVFFWEGGLLLYFMLVSNSR